MAIKIYFRRLTSVLLCCLLVFCSLPVQVDASDPVTAASLAITGGQLAGAGLSGEAALSLAGPVGAVVGVTLGALGVNAYVSQAAQEAGKTRTRFVLDKLVIWGAQAGYTQEQLYSKIAQGISVAADGTIQLAKDTAKMIEQFGSWLFTQDGDVIESLPVNSSFTLGDYDIMEGFTSTYNGNTYRFPISISQYNMGNLGSINNSGKSCYQFITDGGARFAIITSFYPYGTQSNQIFLQLFNTNGQWPDSALSQVGCSYTTSIGNGLYISYTDKFNSLSTSNVVPITSDPILTVINNITGQTIETSSTSTVDEVFTGTPDSWAENKDLLNPSAEDTPIVLNPDLLNPIIDSLADGQQATMGIVDYLEALQDAWDHALDDVQTAIGTITDSLTGIQEQIAIPQTAVENPTITNPSVTPDTTPILNPSDVDPGTAITGLSFDLTNIFPFCIPFDIYAALNLLDAEPVAPSYHFHLEWPYNIVIDFTLDLSPFNQVAAVARTMETLLFIVGLAVMTRSMFIRG